ncbi:MAG: VanZ family protein [Bacteroidota bacterium]|nr:VanZ family protein [Bacteroidota bacterium]
MKNFILKNSLSLSITWALIILGLCSMPGQYIPSVSFLELLSFDKWVHAGIFFVLCCLIFFSIVQRSHSKQKIYLLLALAILYGCSLEVMQGTFFSNRSADWSDIIANTVGCIFGLVFYKKLFAWLRKA